MPLFAIFIAADIIAYYAITPPPAFITLTPHFGCARPFAIR
jgi:hypothetical protein